LRKLFHAYSLIAIWKGVLNALHNEFLLPLLALLTALFLGAATYLTYQQMKGFKKKPFSQIPEFIGRQKEIHRLVQQIEIGQSSAVIGAFGNERTAILEALRNPELYGDNANRLIFSFLDISALEKECSQAQFWEYALEPLQEKIVIAQGNDVSDFTRELKELDKQGFVKKENEQWQIRSSVFLELALELAKEGK
jgi:hypothetical protein